MRYLVEQSIYSKTTVIFKNIQFIEINKTFKNLTSSYVAIWYNKPKLYCIKGAAKESNPYALTRTDIRCSQKYMLS